MELGQDAVMGFARAVAEPREARRSTSDATVTRVEDGVAYVALPGGEGDTPVAQSAASVEVGDAVTVEWRGNALHLTGNMSAPSVGGSYVQQRISPVEAEAQVAAEAAARAGEAADSAAVAAGNAQSSANAAAAAAGSAQASADNANEYAARALGNLSTVQSVTETLAWITQHGTMALTADTEPDPTHVYFVADPNGDYVVGSTHYSLVIEPVAADMATYYELTIDESLNNYVGTHLSLTAEGLWLLPASSGAYRILIATGAGTTYTEAGTYIIDANGGVVAQFGTVTRIGHAAESHVDIDYHSMRAIDKEGVTYFHVSDLRGTDGTAEIVESKTYWDYFIDFGHLTFEAEPSGWHEDEEDESDEPELVPEYDYPVTIDDVVVASGIDREADAFVLDNPKDEHGDAIAFTAASVVTATYKTKDPNAKAFTFGSRGTGALGAVSVVEGKDCVASGNFAHAEGYDTKANGLYSHSEGEQTWARGNWSHAEGYSTFAGTYSHAEGYDTTASGLRSHAQNDSTIAASEAQTALGKYNEEDANGDYAVIIGNGTDSSCRSNALTVDWDGNAALATGKLTIEATAGYIYLIHTTDGTTEDVRYRIGISSVGIPDMSASTDGGSSYDTVFYNAIYAGRTGNRVLASPNGSTGAASFRALVAADLPTVTRAKGGTGVTATQESTVTVNTSNATADTENHCWHNGVVASVSYNFTLKASLASNSQVNVGTVPSGFRPPHNFAGSCYTANFVNMQVTIAPSGAITLRNTSGAAFGTGTVCRIGATYAI